jgi:aldehyde:ferredoxin oxidoreductase
VSERLPSSHRHHAPSADAAASRVDPDELFRVDADLHDLIAQTVRPRHFREFRRAKAVRRFIRRHDAALAAAGLSVDERARLVVLAAAIVREAETDDWVCLSEHATDVTDTLRSCVFEIPINVVTCDVRHGRRRGRGLLWASRR